MKEINETKYLIGNYGLKDEVFFFFLLALKSCFPPQSELMKFCSVNLVPPPSHMGPRGLGAPQGDADDKRGEDPPALSHSGSPS